MVLEVLGEVLLEGVELVENGVCGFRLRDQPPQHEEVMG